MKRCTGCNIEKELEEFHKDSSKKDGHSFKCKYCEKPLTEYHVDHVVPLCKGGDNSKENLVIACPKCNLSKGGKLLSEWSK